MKRALLAILVAVLLLPAAFSVVGCASRVGFGVDTFAAIPATTDVKTPDEAEVVLYGLVVKLVAPVKKEAARLHALPATDPLHLSDARYEAISAQAHNVAYFAKYALVGIEEWRNSGNRTPFDTNYRMAIAAAAELSQVPEVKR